MSYGGGVNEVGWRAAMEAGLYGADGFFVRGVDGPGGHFRTSVHASPLFAGAVGRLLGRVDAALGHPAVFDLVDVGAGRGELLTALLAGLDASCGQTPENVAPAGYFSAHPVTGVGEGVAAGDEIRKSDAPKPLVERLRIVAVEKAPRPDGLDSRVHWRSELPGPVTGLVLATEWLDNVPLDVAERDDRGMLRRVLVDPRTGDETTGPPVDAADRMWIDR